MSAMPILSSIVLKHDIDALRTSLSLPETEDSWETILRSIISLTSLCQHGGCDFAADLISIIRSFSRPLTSAMNSERTRLSGAAIDLVGTMAAGLGVAFEPLLPIFFPTLLTLCTRTNKVITSRARICIVVIIETTQLPSILPYFLQSIKDKSASLRLTAAEGTMSCMNCFNPPDLERDIRARDIEAIIRATARDAHGDIRKVSRKIFEAYKLLLPSRVESFTGPLTPTMKKYLDIKSSTTRQKPVNPRLEPKNFLSSSTSAQSSTGILPEPPQTKSHTKSASSSAISTIDSSGHAAEVVVAGTSHTNAGMPPPQYVPVRPIQPSDKTISAGRSTSDMGGRKRTTSCVSTPAVPAGSRSTKNAHSNVLMVPPARPTSASSVRAAPRRPQIFTPLSSSLQGVGVSGPRRVPLPELTNSSNEGKGPKVSNPTISRVDTVATRALPSYKSLKPQVNAIRMQKAEAIQKPSSLGPGMPSSGLPIEKISKSRSVTQPTLSQLSRAKAAAEHKSTAGAASKPLWGRPAPRKANTVTKPSHAVVQKAVAPSVGSTLKADHPRANTPVHSPLSPSSASLASSPLLAKANGSNGSSTHVQASPSPVGTSTMHRDNDRDDVTEVEASNEHVTAAAESSRETIAEPNDSINDQCDEMPCPISHAIPSADVDAVASEPDSVAVVEDPVTPRVLPSSSDTMDLPAQVTCTPISALLSSIQRGFIFTPSPPLSPPRTYLARSSIPEEVKDLYIPSPLHDKGPDARVSTKEPFRFGIGSEAGRHAFANVENV